LISLFLKGEGDPSEAAAILEYGRVYLRIMLWGLLLLYCHRYMEVPQRDRRYNGTNGSKCSCCVNKPVF